MRNQQIERYWNADLQYRKRNVMIGVTVLLLTSLWIDIFGYWKTTLAATTAAASSMGLFLSSVVLYRIWDYFERGIRDLKHELYIDVHETSEEHRYFVHGLGNLIKARENGNTSREVRNNAHPPNNCQTKKSEQEGMATD